MNKIVNHRETFIDIARGIGILLVVFSHSGSEKGLMTYVGGMFIPIFFVISGYLYNGANINIARKAKKLLVPYLGYSLFFLILYKGFKINDIIGIFYSRYCFYPYNSDPNVFFLSSGNAPLWFLTAFFLSQLLFAFLMGLDKNKRIFGMICCLGTVFAMQNLPILLPWSIDVVPLFVIYMYLGYCGKQYSTLSLPTLSWTMLFLAYFVICYFNGEPNLSVRIYGLSILLISLSGLIGSLVVMKLSEKIEDSYAGRFLSIVGQHSMTIFCIQMFLLRMQNKVFFDILHLPASGLYLHGINIVKILLACVIGIFISKAIDRCKQIINIRIF